jgi:hypothetical protein
LAKFENPVRIHELKRGDVFYEKGYVGMWAQFVALEDGALRTITDGIGQEFPVLSVVVKVTDISSSDRSRINSIIKITDDPSLEGNIGPKLFRTKIDEEGDIPKPLQGDWQWIGKK